jgi:hypothetical protein
MNTLTYIKGEIDPGTSRLVMSNKNGEATLQGNRIPLYDLEMDMGNARTCNIYDIVLVKDSLIMTDGLMEGKGRYSYIVVKGDTIRKAGFDGYTPEDLVIIGDLPLTVFSPDSLYVGQSNVDIRWQSYTLTDTLVDIFLISADTVAAIIAEGTKDDGSFNWPLIPYELDSGHYRIRISNATTPSEVDECPDFYMSGIFGGRYTVDSTNRTGKAIEGVYNQILLHGPGTYFILLPSGEYTYGPADAEKTIVLKTLGTTADNDSFTVTIAPLDPNRRPVLKAIYGGPAFTIQDNNITIEGLEIVSESYGIQIGDTTFKDGEPAVKATISRCYIHPPLGKKMKGGIILQNDDNSPSDSVVLVNNIIADATEYGIQITNTSANAYSGLRIINNTVLMDGTAESSYGFSLEGPTANDAVLQNNIIYNATKAALQAKDPGGTLYRIGHTFIFGTNDSALNIKPNSNFNTSDFVVFEDPILSAYSSKSFSPGYPMNASPVRDNALDSVSPPIDFTGRSRSVPDIGAMEWTDRVFCDTIFVSVAAGNDTANKGDNLSRPLRTIQYAFDNRIPSPLRYPIVVQVQPGNYRDTVNGHYAYTLKSDIYAGGSVSITSNPAIPTRPEIICPVDTAVFFVQSNNINIEGLTIHVRENVTGIVIDNNVKNASVRRCLFRPAETGRTYRSAIELQSGVKRVKIENCLISYAGDYGAIYSNGAAIDSVNIVYNSLFLGNRAGKAGIRLNPIGGSVNMQALKVAYNIFDNPGEAAIVNSLPSMPLGAGCDVNPNLIYNSVIGKDLGTAIDTTGNLIDDPGFFSTDVTSLNFLRPSCSSNGINTAGTDADTMSSGVDYEYTVRPRSPFADSLAPTQYDFGAYESYSCAERSCNPLNLHSLNAYSPAESTFIVQINGVWNYDTREIDSIALLWNLVDTGDTSSQWPDKDPHDPAASVMMYDVLALQNYLTAKTLTIFTDTLNGQFAWGGTYYFIARSHCIGGAWSKVDTASIHTVQALAWTPEPPPNYMCILVDTVPGTPTSIKIDWSKCDTNTYTAAHKVDTLGVRYGPFYPGTMNDPQTELGFLTTYSSSGSMTLTGFAPEQRYYFSMFVRNKYKVWSLFSEKAQDNVYVPQNNDSTPPVNNIAISVDTVSATSIALTWSCPTAALDQQTKTGIYEDSARIGIYYDTLPITDISGKAPKKTVMRDSGATVLLDHLIEQKLYYFAAVVGDSVPNWSGITAASYDSVKTPLAGHIITVVMFEKPDTMTLEFNTGSIRMGWDKTLGHIEVDVSFQDTTLPHNGFIELSDVVHFLSNPQKGDNTVYIEMPVTPVAGVPLKNARVYGYSDSTGLWYVEYSSRIDTVNNLAMVDLNGLNYHFRVMYDQSPPLVVYPLNEWRFIEGIAKDAFLSDTLTITDTQVANPRIYLTYSIGGTGNASWIDSTIHGVNGTNMIGIGEGFITSRGIMASARITDGTYDTTFNLSYPVLINSYQMKLRPKSGKGIFNLFSVPGQINDPDASKIFRSIIEQGYDQKKLRLYRYNSASLFYEEIYTKELTETNLWNIEAGKAYWVTLRDDPPVAIDAGAGRTIRADQEMQLAGPLNAGWTDIGIPFNFEKDPANGSTADSGIYLGDIINASSFAGNSYFYYYDNNNESFIPLFDLVSFQAVHSAVLRPWYGYSVYNSLPGSVLKFPPVSKNYSTLLKRAGKYQQVNKEAREGAWWMQVSAAWNGGKDVCNGIGTRPNAGDLPKFAPKPFAPGNKITLNTFHHVANDESVAVAYSYQDNLGTGKLWSFALANNTDQPQAVDINLLPEGDLPKNYRCVVWNPLLPTQKMELNEDSAFTVVLERRDTLDFKVIAGSAAYIDQILKKLMLPKEFSLTGNFPNPFNPVTVIQFEVPYHSKKPVVDLKIYDIRGRLITTLYRDKNPGFHTVKWTGRDYANRPVSSGIYFVRMVAAADGDPIFNKTRKMSLVK